jgi:hypothetical protein
LDTAAIYGFEFTRSFDAGGFHFEPVSTDQQEIHGLARDLERHHLTGTVSAPTLSREALFDLSAILSFIEHLDVRLSLPITMDDTPAFPERFFDLALPAAHRNNGGGAVVGCDAFNPWKQSRQQFIERALLAMTKRKRPRPSGPPLLLYKCVETFRQRSPFVEITYFLLISALEAFCRAEQDDFATKSGVEPIVKTLRAYGFDAENNLPSKPERSMVNYFHLRNALFHEGLFTRTVNVDGTDRVLNCSDYLFHLSMLVSLTVMKAVGFDDGQTNWDCWIDRQLWKPSPLRPLVAG